MLLNALFYLNIKTSSLDAEIMTELILSGKAQKLLEEKAALAQERNRIFDRIFPEAVPPGTPAAFFRWLPLPHLPMDDPEIERRLLQQNVSVHCSCRFTVSHLPQRFMRLAISSPGTPEELHSGLTAVRSFLQTHSASEEIKEQ